MAVRPSRTADLPRLIQDLVDGDVARRESAAARLTLVGLRAVPALLDAAERADAPLESRAAALHALAGIADPRAVPVAVRLLDGPDRALALDAIDVLQSVVNQRSVAATTAFDRLAELALNRTAPPEERLAAIAALEDLPERLLRPLYEALAADDSSRAIGRVVRRQAGAMLSLADFVEHGLPDDPAVVDSVIRDEGPTAALTTIGRAIAAVRERERRETGTETAWAWSAVRGQLHQALAERKSRLGLYDLRETVAAARRPLPVGFAGALAVIGDRTCLDAIAAAWSASADGDERWWREHLADAFGAIVRRERLSRTSPILRKILERRPAAGPLVALGRLR